MTTFLVATVSRYVLVDAENADQAREAAQAPLYDLYADTRARMGQDFPIAIHTVRPATPQEIDLWNWHHEMLKQQHAAK